MSHNFILKAITLISSLLIFSCSGDNDAQNINEDINHNSSDADLADGGDVELNQDSDAGDDAPHPTLENIQLSSLEGMVELSWELSEENTLTHIRISASPPALMWGESVRLIDATETGFLFDQLVNGIHYEFTVHGVIDNEEVGDIFQGGATPYARPLLAASGGPGILLIDSITREQARGWNSIQHSSRHGYWSPDGTKLVTITCDIFDRHTRKRMESTWPEEFDAPCASFNLSWSPDSRYIAFTKEVESDPEESARFTYDIIDVNTKEIQPGWPELPYPHADQHVTHHFAWSPDGERLAIAYGHTPSQLKIINTQTKEFEPGWPELPVDSTQGGFSSKVRAIEWSPDSKRLAIAFHAAFIPEISYLVIDAESQEFESGWFQGDPQSFGSSSGGKGLSWSPDGELLAVIYGRSKLLIINTSTKDIDPEWPDLTEDAHGIGWSHDSRYLSLTYKHSLDGDSYLRVIDRDDKMEYVWDLPLDRPGDTLNWSPMHDPPTAPSQANLSRTDTAAVLSWDPGEKEVLDYRITVEPADKVEGDADYLIHDPSATEHVIDGLDPDVDYRFHIRAIDIFGVGEAATLF